MISKEEMLIYLLLRLSPNSLNLKQRYKQLLVCGNCSVGKKKLSIVLIEFYFLS